MVLARNHPRAGRNGYVFEHVLVMEDLLGRHLMPGETVHHLNGLRNDNRPENLELWTRPQPTGIRARDAVAWAQEVLARYGDGRVLEGTLPAAADAAAAGREPTTRVCRGAADGTFLEVAGIEPASSGT